MKNLIDENKGFGSIIRIWLLTLLVLTICTCSGQRLTLGNQTLESQTDFSTFSGKLAKQMTDATEYAILKTDVVDFHLWLLEKQLAKQRYQQILDSVYCQSQGLTLKKCLPIKSYQYQSTTLFSLSQFKTVWTGQKQSLHIVYPLKYTRRKLETNEKLQDISGLDTTIDWKNTGDNSYDGEKLKLLVHDESGKWEKPNNILNNWRVTRTCLRLGSKIIGKCMMGSTSNAHDKGGKNFKKLYDDSDVTQRNANGQTRSGLYSLFIPMEWNYEGYIDSYGIPVFNTPSKPTEGPQGEKIKIGVIEYWENEVEGLKQDQDALNEFYRQFPRTEKHAFRDETKQSLFNLTKIYEQIDLTKTCVIL